MSVDAVNGGEEAFSAPQIEEYEVKPSDKFFSREFSVLEKDWPKAVISTNKAWHGWNPFDWRAHYQIRDANTGNLIAEAVKNYGILSLKGIYSGSFLGIFRSATLADFDVYDAKGDYIGYIDGKVFDLSKARFDFQDKEGNIKAYAREEKTQIYIRDYQTNGVVGYMKRHFDTGTEDPWKLKITGAVDKRVALLFAAYVVQHQSHFLKDI